MTIRQVTDTFYEITGRRLHNTSQMNLFPILLDHDGDTHFMNIFRSFVVDETVSTDTIFYDTYEVGHDAWWDNISAELYGTPYLWWIIALINNVTNPFEELEEGSNIKYLRSEYLYTLFKDIERLAAY